jgi:hypothetical protein
MGRGLVGKKERLPQGSQLRVRSESSAPALLCWGRLLSLFHLIDAPHLCGAVDEQDTVQMVDLVLEDASQPALRLEMER